MSRENEVCYWLPCSVVFVSTAHEAKRDIMTATAMFVSEKEPLILISVARGHLTEKLINQRVPAFYRQGDRSGRFGNAAARLAERRVFLVKTNLKKWSKVQGKRYEVS